MTDKKKARPDVRALIKKTAQETREALDATIMAPIVPGCRVRVRINGIISEFELDDQEFTGFGLVKPLAQGQAKLLGEASLAQVRAYLELLPKFQMVMLKELDGTWWGLPAQGFEKRIAASQPLPIKLVSRALSFDTASVRFDGTSFWFEAVSRRRNPAVARTLRDQMLADVFPEELVCPEVTPQERLAYSLMFYDAHPQLLEVEQSQTSPGEVQNTFDYDSWLKEFQAMRGILERENEMQDIGKALQHAGARMHSYWRSSPKDEHVSVKILVDEQEHIAVVRGKDLTVINAGICLSGQDDNFDLTSLVGVLREHRRSR